MPVSIEIAKFTLKSLKIIKISKVCIGGDQN